MAILYCKKNRRLRACHSTWAWFSSCPFSSSSCASSSSNSSYHRSRSTGKLERQLHWTFLHEVYPFQTSVSRFPHPRPTHQSSHHSSFASASQTRQALAFLGPPEALHRWAWRLRTLSVRSVCHSSSMSMMMMMLTSWTSAVGSLWASICALVSKQWTSL